MDTPPRRWREAQCAWAMWEELPATNPLLIRRCRSGHYVGGELIKPFDKVDQDRVSGPLVEIDEDYQPLRPP